MRSPSFLFSLLGLGIDAFIQNETRKNALINSSREKGTSFPPERWGEIHWGFFEFSSLHSFSSPSLLMIPNCCLPLFLLLSVLMNRFLNVRLDRVLMCFGVDREVYVFRFSTVLVDNPFWLDTRTFSLSLSFPPYLSTSAMPISICIISRPWEMDFFPLFSSTLFQNIQSFQRQKT